MTFAFIENDIIIAFLILAILWALALAGMFKKKE
jgi:hypothetical protein